jgi:signal transduction histidine kinase
VTRVSASLRFRLIAGAAAIAMVAVFAALLAAYGAAETSRRIEQSVAAQRRMDLLSTLSARISDYAVMAVEASSAAAPAEVRAARLQSRASLVDDAFTRIDTALAEAVAEARREGETEQMRRATRSLVLARMRAQFQALTRRVVAAGPRPELRAALDSFATQFSPLLNEAIADERRDRDAAAAGVAGLRDRMIWLALGAGVIATVLVILFHLLLIRPLIDRLGRAAQAADEIGRGAFDVALPVALRDELGQLFEVINRMAARLKARRDDVDADRARLNELVSARTAELSEANERLSRIDAERRRFFADVGHELRTPLTVILAEAELGLKDGMEAADTQSALSVIRSRAVRLSRRIDDLLRVARSETGRIELNSYPFDLAEAAADAAADMAPLAKHRQMRLTCRLDPAPAIGDRDWCRQVVSGLIENASRMARRSGFSSVSPAAHARRPGPASGLVSLWPGG